MSLRRFKCRCSYDGTAYCGWQVQPGLVSIQSLIEEKLAIITKVPVGTIKIHGSGRTDQGVHARGQVFHVALETRMTGAALLRALNARLPLDIRIHSCTPCSATFHARRSATAKEYRYFIWNSRIVPVDKRLYHTCVVHKLDTDAMTRALPYFLGTHDFAAFSANPQRPIETTVRTIFDFTLRQRGPEIILAVRGSGFLYKMVRSLAGFLIRVGSGHEKPEAITALLTPGTPRTARVPSAPPQGLFLWKVWYDSMGKETPLATNSNTEETDDAADGEGYDS